MHTSINTMFLEDAFHGEHQVGQAIEDTVVDTQVVTITHIIDTTMLALED